MTCSSELLRFFSGNISPVLPCRRQICWCSGMFSCVNGAARGPQGQPAGDVMIFFHADFHIAKIWKSNYDNLFFQHFHMDKLWQVDCCLNKTPYRLLEGSMRVWTFECTQPKKIGFNQQINSMWGLMEGSSIARVELSICRKSMEIP